MVAARGLSERGDDEIKKEDGEKSSDDESSKSSTQNSTTLGTSTAVGIPTLSSSTVRTTGFPHKCHFSS